MSENNTIWYGIEMDTSQMEAGEQRITSIFARIEDNADKTVSRVEKVFETMGKLAGLKFRMGDAKELISQIARVRSEVQGAEAMFKMMMQQAGQAGEFTGQLLDYSKENIFGFSDLAAQAAQLMAYGTAVESLIPELDMLSNIAAGTWLSLGELIEMYNQARTSDVLLQEEIGKWESAGVPVIRELANQFRTSQEAIGDMIASGSIGFAELEKVLVSLTSEGGEFGGVMDEQMETLAGSLVQLENSLTAMFNGLGESSEGFLTTAVSGLTFLVDHYQEIGKIVTTLTAAYGSYKVAAAICALTENGWTVAQGLHLKMLILVEKAQQMLNKTMLANPYVLAFMALATLVTGLVSFSNSSNKAASITSELNSNIREETDELDKLFTQLKNAAEGTDDRRTAIEQINNNYGDYLSNLLTEKSSVEEVAAAYDEVKRAIVEAQLAKARAKFTEDAEKNLNENIGGFHKQAAKVAKQLDNDQQRGRFLAYTEEIIRSVVEEGNFFSKDKLDQAFRAAQSDGNYGSLQDWEDAVKRGEADHGKGYQEGFFNRSMQRMADFGNWVDWSAEGYRKANSDFDQFQAGYLGVMEKPITVVPPKVMIPSEEVEQVKGNIEALTKHIDDLRTGVKESVNLDKDIADAEKQLKKRSHGLKP